MTMHFAASHTAQDGFVNLLPGPAGRSTPQRPVDALGDGRRHRVDGRGFIDVGELRRRVIQPQRVRQRLASLPQLLAAVDVEQPQLAQALPGACTWPATMWGWS